MDFQNALIVAVSTRMDDGKLRTHGRNNEPGCKVTFDNGQEYIHRTYGYVLSGGSLLTALVIAATSLTRGAVERTFNPLQSDTPEQQRVREESLQGALVGKTVAIRTETRNEYTNVIEVRIATAVAQAAHVATPIVDAVVAPIVEAPIAAQATPVVAAPVVAQSTVPLVAPPIIAQAASVVAQAASNSSAEDRYRDLLAHHNRSLPPHQRVGVRGFLIEIGILRPGEATISEAQYERGIELLHRAYAGAAS